MGEVLKPIGVVHVEGPVILIGLGVLYGWWGWRRRRRRSRRRRKGEVVVIIPRDGYGDCDHTGRRTRRRRRRCGGGGGDG